MRQISDYPQWYRTLRVFMFGSVCGAGIVAEAAAETMLYSGMAYYLVIFGCFVILGLCELVFAVRRHHRLVRDLDSARSANV